MALSNITFQKGTGGLQRRSTSEDGISALLFYGVAPAGWGSDAAKQIFSVTEAETLGITEEITPVLHYHVTEFFRIHKSGSLYVGIFAPPAEEVDHTFAEVETVQNFSNRTVRQIGVFTEKPFETSMITALQQVCANAAADHGPLNAFLVADITELTLTALTEIRTLNAPNASVLIGQDGAGKGSDLYTDHGFTIGMVGAFLGAVALSNVQESVAWVGKFNVGGSELDVPAFGNGVLFKELTNTQLNEIDTKGYIFLQKHTGIGGTYFSSSWTASNGDYDTIEKNRAIDKAIRGLRTALLPFLNSPVYVNATTGKLSEDTVQAFSNEANRPLSAMEAAGNVSGARAYIDPDQNVLSDDELEVVVEIVPVGVSRSIVVKIGYTLKLSQS